MKNQVGLKIFEKIKQVDEAGNEYWSARQLSAVLEYSEYRHFLPVIAKAKKSCQNSGCKALEHFVEVLEMVEIGSGAARAIEDVKLSRYACYLIVQNANPSKEVVVLGQSYFAMQTILQEVEKKLASAAKEAGVVTSIDYAVFQNHGYQGLYGGLDSKGIHKKKGLKKSEKILDHMGSTELAANLFRATQAEEKLRREKITGKQKANKTHFEVGKIFRQTINEFGGTMPENLTAVESIRSIERKQRVKLKRR